MSRYESSVDWKAACVCNRGWEAFGTVLACQQEEKTMTKTLCVLVLIGAATLIGYSQEMASEYVSPSEAAPSGKAPKMQVQLLNPGEPMEQYAVIFYQGTW